MTVRAQLILASLVAASAVALGGILRTWIGRASSRIQAIRKIWFAACSGFETGVRYQTVHALGLFVVALLGFCSPEIRGRTFSGWAFLAGIVLFSGSLYLMTFAPPSWKVLGAIVPIGGVAFITGLAVDWLWRPDNA